MDLLDNIALGFATAFSLKALLFCLGGVTLGTLIGVLPGIGPLATIAMLLPVTFHAPPTEAMIMLAGIYYGAQYGGSTASILLNLPGTASSAVTTLDGYPMAQQGRAGVALFITTIASFVGSLFGIVLLVACAPALAEFALRFGAAEYFSLMVLGLLAAAMLGQGTPARGVAMVMLGLLIGIVGTDVHTGQYRFVFGISEIAEGVSLVAVAMGLFGVSEVIANARRIKPSPFRAKDITWRSLLPTRQDMRLSWKAMFRGTAIGAGFGTLPGTGSTIASFVAYAVEKRAAKDRSRFGKGAVEGIAAPEAANNAAAQTAFIPTLTLGIPGDVVMALMLGALIIHGIIPGPSLVAEHPKLFWGLIASFLIGNVVLVILNLPLIGLWVRILTIPYRYLYPSILVFICIGVYSVRTSVFDVFLVVFFGFVGYGMLLLRFEPAPLILGMILGPMLEENLRRALTLSRGDPMVFLERPISATILAATAFLVALTVWLEVRHRRRVRLAAREGDAA
jgi:putative tricarboxylic transport membrane protein